MADFWKNSAAILASGFVALIVAELTLRWFWRSPPQGVLMMSPPAMVMAAEGVVTYAPNALLRVATADRQSIIYDVRVRTNNVGLVDDVPYYPSDENYQVALVGDSFTAGYHGGRPWVPTLRETIPDDWRLYGLGVDGTGVQHFEALLRHLDPNATFDQVLVVVIGNDFYRDHWYLTAGSKGVWFCRVADTRERCTDDALPIIQHVPYDASDEQVLATARSVLDVRATAEQPMRVPALLKQTTAAVLAPDKTERLLDAEVTRNLNALKLIVDRYGRERVSVVHLPALPEVHAGDYDLDLAGFAKQHGITYFAALTECPFSTGMFHPREPHPNTMGYEHIARCVERAMRESITVKSVPESSQAVGAVGNQETV